MNQNLKIAAAALTGIAATVAAGGIAFATMDNGLGKLRGVDVDNNGEITRAEWLQTTGARFDAIDTNKDGKLVVGEIPARPEHRDRGPGRHDRRDFDRDEAAAPAPASVAAPIEDAVAPAN